MRRCIVSFMGIVLLIFVTQGVVASPAQGDGCRACHLGEPHSKGQVKADNDCQACHSNTFTTVAVAATVAQPVRPSVASRTTATLLPGMTLPMYYAESRIGDSPNEMALIPAGEFIRGTNVRLPDEGPQHVVNLPAFYIDKYEVTNLQYKKYIDEVGRRAPDHFVEGSYPPGKVDHPITYVSWSDAKRYCEWAGKRLPSDVEWEKAARGSDGRTFPWGNEFIMEGGNTPVRWETLQLEGDTTPVGAFEKGVSPYGLYDVSGNVWEWTDSWYMAYPGNKRITENYGQKYRTLKGGSWWDCSFYKCGISSPVYNRSFFSPRVKNSSFGFRCAKDASSP